MGRKKNMPSTNSESNPVAVESPNTGITAQDLKVLRMATSFAYHQENDTGSAKIIAYLRMRDLITHGKLSGLLNSTEELKYEIQVHGGMKYKAHFYAMYSPPEWRLLVKLLKVGDELYFKAKSNGNKYLLKATYAGDDETPTYSGLYLDELRVDVKRVDPRARGGYRWVIQDLCVDSEICPQNSARAIQEV